MVSVMPFDRRWQTGVAPVRPISALVLAIAACAPTISPPAPPAEPGPIAKMHVTPAAAGGRQIMVGEMCPQVAAGRPAVQPLLMRTVQWSDNAGEVASTVERGSVPRFVVYGTDGGRAGVFDTMGLVDIAPAVTVASGAYAGASPCSYALTAKPADGSLATRAEDAHCAAVTSSCGLAVAAIEAPDEPPEVADYATGGACIAGDQLAVDIDGDGRVESFPLADVLDGIRGPAQEWVASQTASAACKPQFQLYDIKLIAPPETGTIPDPKSTVMMDVLGVVDLDGDGRKELVLALRFATVRSVVVYSAIDTPLRLTMVGEAASLPR